jgi:hypothetical protein
MFRNALLLMAMAASVLVSPNTGVAQKSRGLKLGDKFEGELGGRKTTTIRYRVSDEPTSPLLGGQEGVYATSIPITLKAGQAISITASVTGNERIVGIQVFDPTQQRIGVPKPRGGIQRFGAAPEALASVKSHTLSIEEVNAGGRYTIVVFSDKIGPFTLKATSDSEEEEHMDDRETLEKQLRDAKKKVEQLEAKLKAMDEKPKSKKK